MTKIRKYTTLGILFIFLIIPIVLGIFNEYLYIRELNFTVIFILVIGVTIFLTINKLIEVYGYNMQSFEAIKNQDVINALIAKDNKSIIWFFLPVIMIIEELIFRYYLIGILLNFLQLSVIMAILISSIIFSLFHIHIWFRFKNLRILIINLGYSFLLGLFNGYILLTLGIIPCILIHYILVIMMYFGIYKKFYKNKKNED